jgi:hypothetical protein
MGYILLGYLLFFGLSGNLGKNLPGPWAERLGIAQLVVGGLALVFGLCALTPDLLILLNLRHAQSVGAGFGLLVGGFFALTGGLLMVGGKLTRDTAAERADEDEQAAETARTPDATVARASLGQKVVLTLSLAAMVGGMAAVCSMNATTLKGESVLRQEIRSANPSPLEFSVGAPAGVKYLIVVHTGTTEAWRSRKTVRAGYKFEYVLLDPNGRDVIRRTDEYYSAADRVIQFVPTATGTYKLSVRPTSTLKDARTCPSVRVYRNDRRIMPALFSRIGLWTD